MKEIEVEIDGQFIKGYAVMKNGVLWTHARGETWTTDVGGVRRSSGKKAGASTNVGEITAPMPGKIIKIMAPKGAVVSKGDVVIVMEAMKMEYTLKAAADGTISMVAAEAGEQVALGKVLAKLDVKP